jgi:tripartite-type tricarboxylate transporter receptor subunit TctC
MVSCGRRAVFACMSAFLCVSALLCSAFVGGAALAAFPERPVSLIVTFTAGGGSDLIARLVASKLGPALGQQVVVENKPGAGGAIGVDLVAKAAPDGYTLLLVNHPPFASFSGIEPPPPFDPIKDFAPIGLVCAQDNILVVHPSLPVKSLPEFVAYAKANPGKISYASPGVGTPFHLGMEFLKQLEGLDMVHIAYRGMAQAIPELVSGQVTAMFATHRSVQPLIAEGKVRLLAAGSPDRMRTLPDLPTVAEYGYPKFNIRAWFGIVAPAATPRPVVAQLSAALETVLDMAEVQEKLRGMALEPIRAKPDEFAKRIRDEADLWLPIVKAAKIKAE